MEKKKVAPKKTQKKETVKNEESKKQIKKVVEKVDKKVDKKEEVKIAKEIRIGQEVLVPFKKIEQFGGEILGRIQCDKRLESYFSIWFDMDNFIERNDKYYVKGMVERYIDGSNWEIRFSRKNAYFTININENMLEGIE